MRLYFDTNVYAFIAARNESRIVRGLLRRDALRLCASDINLEEILVIKDAAKRAKELDSVALLMDVHASAPDTWKDASELRGEIERLRPSWMRSIPTGGAKIRRLKRAQARKWASVRSRDLRALEAYIPDAAAMERGRQLLIGAQKTTRSATRNGQQKAFFVRSSNRLDVVDLGFGVDPERHWRIHGMMAWYHTLTRPQPGTAGHREWLAPYLKLGALNDVPSYNQFWLQDVSAGALPRNRATGLADFYQLSSKITHGNAGDKRHACALLEADLFITADRQFAAVLSKVRECLAGASLARIALVDRAADSAAVELERIIAEYGSSASCAPPPGEVAG